VSLTDTISKKLLYPHGRCTSLFCFDYNSMSLTKIALRKFFNYLQLLGGRMNLSTSAKLGYSNIST